MNDHLIVSTLFLAAAVAAARFLPFTARTRYAIVLAGLVKFAVPTEAFRIIPEASVPSPLRVLGGGGATTAVSATPGIDWLPILWAAVALLVFARWFLLRARTVSAALRGSVPASPREQDALRAVRLALGVRTAIDIIRSPVCEAPAVLRMIRPVIVLPFRGADDLDDDELRSLLLHECAHVARHDNLAALLQALAASLLWFHPLVWLASHELSGAREEACDETVADAMQGTGSYVSALTKLCHAALAPRTAGVSCMASSRMKQRMEHLMSYESIKRSAWPHRATLAAMAAAIMISTLSVAGTGTAREPIGLDTYNLQTQITPEGDRVAFHFTVWDKKNGKVIATPSVTTNPNQPATVRFSNDHDGRTTDFLIEARGTLLNGNVTFLVKVNGETLHDSSHEYTRTGDHYSGATGYSGQPISINVKNADIHDVMRVFAELTGLEIIVAPAVKGSVTMDVTNMPWDQVLEQIVREHGFDVEIDEKTIRLTKSEREK